MKIGFPCPFLHSGKTALVQLRVHVLLETFGPILSTPFCYTPEPLLTFYLIFVQPSIFSTVLSILGVRIEHQTGTTPGTPTLDLQPSFPLNNASLRPAMFSRKGG